MTRDPIKRQEYNGAGMRSLAPEVRAKIMGAAMEKHQTQTSGWPSSIQKEGQPDTYHEATDVWAERMAFSKRGCGR